MRHSDDNTVKVLVSGSRNNLINDWNHGFRSFKTKSLGTNIFCCKELFECFSSVQSLKDTQLLIKCWSKRCTFNLGLNPTLFICVLNMHVLNTDCAAVRIAQNSKQFVKSHLVTSSHSARKEFTFKIPNGESVRSKV